MMRWGRRAREMKCLKRFCYTYHSEPLMLLSKFLGYFAQEGTYNFLWDFSLGALWCQFYWGYSSDIPFIINVHWSCLPRISCYYVIVNHDMNKRCNKSLFPGVLLLKYSSLQPTLVNMIVSPKLLSSSSSFAREVSLFFYVSLPFPTLSNVILQNPQFIYWLVCLINWYPVFCNEISPQGSLEVHRNKSHHHTQQLKHT